MEKVMFLTFLCALLSYLVREIDSFPFSSLTIE